MFWFEGRGLGLPVSVGELSLRVGTHLVLLTQMPELAYTPPSTGKRASSGPHTSHGASSTQVLKVVAKDQRHHDASQRCDRYDATAHQHEPCCAIHTVTVNPEHAGVNQLPDAI